MYCKNCGKKIEDTDKFCPYCGDRTSDVDNIDDVDNIIDDSDMDLENAEDEFVEEIVEEQEDDQEKRNTGKYVGIVVGALVLAFIIGFAGLKYLDHQSDKALKASIERQEKENAAKEKEREERDAAIQKNKEEEKKKEKEREEEKKKREEEKKKLEEEEAEREKNKVDTSGDYVLPESNTKYYSKSEIDALSEEQVFYARNEIYARHGRKFQMDYLDQYFRSKEWYNPSIDPEKFDSLGDSLFNDYEIKNRDALLEREQELNGN